MIMLKITNFVYIAAKNPGSWANGLKVCTIDDFADQIIGITTTGLATAGIDNRIRCYPSLWSNSFWSWNNSGIHWISERNYHWC